MSDDVLGFLGDTPGTEEPTVEQPTPEPEVTVEPQAEPEPAVKTPPATPEPAQAPLAALLDEREKRQAAEKRARELEERWAQAQRGPPPTDADQLQAALYAQNLRASRKFAEREYGKDIVATVHDWAASRCDADPIFNAQMRSSDDPYEAAMQAWNREQIAAKVTPERLAAFEAWEAAQAQAQQDQPQTQQPAATPPRSLVTAPGTGLAGNRDKPPEEGAAFGAAFGS